MQVSSCLLSSFQTSFQLARFHVISSPACQPPQLLSLQLRNTTGGACMLLSFTVGTEFDFDKDRYDIQISRVDSGDDINQDPSKVSEPRISYSLRVSIMGLYWFYNFKCCHFSFLLFFISLLKNRKGVNWIKMALPVLVLNTGRADGNKCFYMNGKWQESKDLSTILATARQSYLFLILFWEVSRFLLANSQALWTAWTEVKQNPRGL